MKSLEVIINISGITDNSKSIQDFKWNINKILFKWLNKRSQKKSYTWEQYEEMLKIYPLAEPKICVNIYDI